MFLTGGGGVIASAQIVDDTIVNADINSAAGIVDSKLAQIVTASKVSGAAVTLLTSVPAGAGLLPVANQARQTLFATTQVFSGTSPTTYTDLDLSAVVGAVQRVVMLRIVSSVGTSMRFGFKRKGDAGTYSASEQSASHAVISSTAGDSVYVVTTTDASGVIQWVTGTAQACTLNVEAYW